MPWACFEPCPGWVQQTFLLLYGRSLILFTQWLLGEFDALAQGEDEQLVAATPRLEPDGQASSGANATVLYMPRSTFNSRARWSTPWAALSQGGTSNASLWQCGAS